MQEAGLANYEGLIWNGSGGTMLNSAGPLHNGSVLDLVLYGLWRGVLALDELGAVESILEGDSKIIISWAAGSLAPWCYLDKIVRIRHSMVSYGYLVCWVPRSTNSKADELAHQDVSLSSEIVNNLM